jgi:Double zinc ribbon
VSDGERRCPNCGALVTASATWCGQCFASLEEPRAATVAPPEPAAGTPPQERRAPFWPCPICGEENPIELDVCAVCGTPFAAVMRAEPERPAVPPRDAMIRSLLFPGLGHQLVGRGTDGMARGVLFVVTAGIAVLLGLSTAASGSLTASFALFVLAAIGVYVMSAVEAYRLAEGEDLLVPTQTLVWILLGVVFLGIALLAFGVVTATHR